MGDGFTAPPSTAAVTERKEEKFDDDDEGIEGRNIEVNFKEIEIFQEQTKYVTFLRPLTNEDIHYTLKRNHSVKIIKSNFELNHYKGVLKPNQNFKLGVTYKPTIPSLRDVEIFDYNDSDNENIKITLIGTAIGPHCSFSTKNLDFYKTPKKSLVERKVELSNDSEVTATFKIDFPLNDVFEIEPIEGIVKPQSYNYITIKFRPKNKIGFYFRKLFCIIWNSETLSLNLLGLSSANVVEEIGLMHVFNDQYFGCKAYLETNFLNLKKEAFTISTNYVDFGYATSYPKVEIITITNYKEIPVLVDWTRGKNNENFQINPLNMKILPKNTERFEIIFKPESPYNVFHDIMVAQLGWIKTQKNSTIPLTTTIRLQGHSFPNNQGWIANVKILPEVVYFQPCTPGDVTYTTFLLKNQSHLPILYKFVPPRKTKITAKPMMGKFRNYEIIVVQLQTSPASIKTYIEEWQIIFNGREDKPITLYFHGETCLPKVLIAKNNSINAGSIQDGSKKKVDVMMKNLTFYSISFEFFLIKKTLLSIDPSSGILSPNESIKLEIFIKGCRCAPSEEVFTCQMRVIQCNGAISGHSYDQIVRVFNECSYSQLCACPSYQNFGRIPFGQRLKCEFQAVNFGVSNIYFQTCQSGDESFDHNFRIKPSFGEIQPQDAKRFSISGIALNLGKQMLHFGYYNRMVKDSPLVTGEPITLFKLEYLTELPIIQFGEIIEHNFGALFSKMDLCTAFFNVARINKIFKDIRYDESADIELRFPEFAIQQDKEFYIKILILNVSDFDTTLELKRTKLCNCGIEEISAGFTERKKGFNCPHREVLNMEFQDSKLTAGNTTVLTIKLKYVLPENTLMCYKLDLSNFRTINIFFNIYAIPANIPRISAYIKDEIWNLENIYIGVNVAPIQMIWFYNNTANLINWEIDVEEINRLCSIEDFNIIEILNPISQIEPYQAKAILIKFHPIEIRTYSVNVNLYYYFPNNDKDAANNCMNYILKGDGIIDLEAHLKNSSAADLIINRVSKITGSFPVSLSIEYIDIKHLPTWSKTQELIFIKNTSRGKILQYTWNAVKIDDVIEITTEPRFCMLQYKEIQPVIIIIKSFSKPCVSTIRLPCEIVHYSDQLMYRITVDKFQTAENRINDYMEEESTFAKRPINPISIHPVPETLFALISIRIITMDNKDFEKFIDSSIKLKQYPHESVANISKNLLKRYYSEKISTYPQKEKLLEPIDLTNGRYFCKILENILS